MEIGTKKTLGIILSRLKRFERPNFALEQYEIHPDIAAEITWVAFYRGEVEDKVIVDLGCGTGIIGFSTVLMGAKKVYFVDIDAKAIEIAKENLKILEEMLEEKLDDKCVFIHQKAEDFDEKVDLVIENPPFGIQSKTHADKRFLQKAFSISPIIYSFHKAESKGFIDAVSKDNGFKVDGYWEFNWPLRNTMEHHKKKMQYIKVGCWRLMKE